LNSIDTFPAMIDPPKLLFYKGNIDLINKYCIAIIGTRKPSQRGIDKTIEIVLNYSMQAAHENKELCIISGLAMGIDITAHIAALKFNIPTIAVLPNPVNHIYPSRHTEIAFDIVSRGGLLLSEHNTIANQQEIIPRLMLRNRIVTGIASLIIPVEYNHLKSGTLNAVKYAQQQNKTIVHPDLF